MDYDKNFMDEVWRRIKEREQAIEIMSALERKKENNVLLVAKEFFGGMGISRLFYGILDVVAVAMVISICIFIGIYIYLGFDSRYVYSMLFIFSPTLYTGIFCLSYVKEMQTRTLYVQMGCRYTFFHVMVFRMLMNSGLAIIFNVIYICTLNHRFDLNLNKALALSFSSLMLFSVILLKSLEAKKKIVSFIWVNAAWYGLNFLIFHGASDLYEEFIDQIPLGILAAAIFLFIVCYYRGLKKILDINYRRRYLNA